MSAQVFGVERALAIRFAKEGQSEELAQAVADYREWNRKNWEHESQLQARRPQPEPKKGKP